MDDVYSVIDDIDVVSQFFNGYPLFNLRQDLKNCIYDKSVVHSELLSYIINGGRSPEYCSLISDILDGKKIEISKIRISDEYNNIGKSGGFRFIVFIERRIKVVTILHVYSKKNKKDLSSNELNKLKRWFKTYIKEQKQLK